jgi:hypothetical protein
MRMPQISSDEVKEKMSEWDKQYYEKIKRPL